VTTNILVLLGGAGIIQSIFLSVYVLTSTLRKQFSNILLLVLNFFILIFLVNSLYLFLTGGQGLKTFSSLSLSCLALIGPLSFFYCKAFLLKTYRFGYAEVLHLAPVMLPVILRIGFCKLHITAVGGYIFVYLLLSASWIGNEEIPSQKKFWICSLMGGLTLLIALIIFFSLGKLCIIGISIGFTVITYFVSYLGIRLYKDVFQLPKEAPEKAVRLSSGDSSVLFSKIDQRVKSEKLYADPELSMPALAHKLDLHTHKLSYVINTETGMNFTEYINGLRAKEAKDLLQTTDLKVAAIAFECGFNSLSAFYATFKKSAGMSPAEFRTKSASKR
jgi:AraC-like DNA-binding protein